MKEIVNNNLFLLKVALKTAPLSTIQRLLWDVKHNVVVFIEHFIMISYIIDSIQFQRPFRNVALFVICVFIGSGTISIFGDYMQAKVNPKAKDKINRKIRLMLFEKAKAIDLECYDNPEYYNDFIWAMNNATERVDMVINTFARFFGAIAGVLVSGGYILTHNKLSMIIVLISFFLLMFLGSRLRKLTFKLDTKLNPIFRKRDYISRVFYLNDYSKEIRLSNIKEKLIRDYDEVNKKIQSEYSKNTRKLAIYKFLINYVCNSFMFDFLYMVYLMYITVVKNAISFGTLAALNNTASQLKRSMLSFSNVLPDFKENSMYISKIKKFLAYENKIITNSRKAKPLPNMTGEFELKNVCFSYSDESPEILHNINLKIMKGQKVAIVGYNGAGKTTLVKTLMRLYDVSAGEILYDGINIKDYDVNEYRSTFAALFQDYQIFAASIMENIIVDNCKEENEKFTTIIIQSGLGDKIKNLHHGLKTQLTKEFSESGTELSGGETQKVSLARSLYKDSNIIILDEPSSALDPIAEYNLNNTMLNLGRDKTIIFISHRLSTTKMADKIFMFDNGCLIEEGSHDELMNLNGKYAAMFKYQSEKYCI